MGVLHWCMDKFLYFPLLLSFRCGGQSHSSFITTLVYTHSINIVTVQPQSGVLILVSTMETLGEFLYKKIIMKRISFYITFLNKVSNLCVGTQKCVRHYNLCAELLGTLHLLSSSRGPRLGWKPDNGMSIDDFTMLKRHSTLLVVGRAWLVEG